MSARNPASGPGAEFGCGTGTSIMACEYSGGGGVVLGADSRTTLGSLVTHRVKDKLTRITDHIYCCCSGSVADTQAIVALVLYQLTLYSMEHNEPPLVLTASTVFKRLCYSYRDALVADLIVAGWDKRLGGQIYCITTDGMVRREAVTVGGSGSLTVYGYVDAHFKPNMSKEEAMEFVINTLALAMLRDEASGGVVRLGVVSPAGCERHLILADQLPRFYED